MLDWKQGSRWLRIDPHIHCPGTLKNNQFGDPTDPSVWQAYADRLRAADPPPSILGITDYFCVRGYELFRSYIPLESIPGLELVFPNVELRLNIKTDKGSPINVHLLVSPDDPEHVEIIQSKLQMLRFSYQDQEYGCAISDLQRLGKAHAKTALDEEAALRSGASQFLAEFSGFRELKRDNWISRNVLFAVAAGADGLGGVSKDSSFHAQREELAATCDVIFSGNPADRAFWSGDHQDFVARGYTTKPCLHGSDAHGMGAVLSPTGDRHCWIRSAPTFDGIRQTLAEPTRRVYIGPECPAGPPSAKVISRVSFTNAPWVKPTDLTLNPGLVSIIGARGSGKTALADLLAFAADASDPDPGPASFLEKARDHLDGLQVKIEWADGTTNVRTLGENPATNSGHLVRYLSQHFVERISLAKSSRAVDHRDGDSSDEGSHDQLLDEIEGVVFEAIPEEDRLLASCFDELREEALTPYAQELAARKEEIRTSTGKVAEEQQLERTLPTLRTRTEGAIRNRQVLETALSSLPMKADAALIKAHADARERLQRLKDAIAEANRRAHRLQEVESAFQRHLRSATTAVDNLRTQFGDILSENQWNRLRLVGDDDAPKMLGDLHSKAVTRVEELRSQGIKTGDGSYEGGVEQLAAALEEAKKKLGEDQARATQRADLEKKLSSAKQSESRSQEALAHAQGARERIRDLQASRLDAYEAVFASLDTEAETLQDLYAPLHKQLAASPELQRLSFYVYRDVDVGLWASRGESLLDLRGPPFAGRNELERIAKAELLPAWRTGDPSEARAAMEGFLGRHVEQAMRRLVAGANPLDLGQWLFSTDHIRVRYGIRYEGVDLERLSPGARGVVLITLYLAIDKSDDRPILIDQPEENLDPKSIYQTLVPFFRDASRRRQIIIVTHNANLVVNADSDQIVVAEAERKSADTLPDISYFAGGLDSAEVRDLACQYLEGGQEAFRRRGQRYGIGIQAMKQ